MLARRWQFTFVRLLIGVAACAGFLAVLRSFPRGVVAFTTAVLLLTPALAAFWCGGRLFRVDRGRARLAGFAVATLGLVLLGLAISMTTRVVLAVFEGGQI